MLLTESHLIDSHCHLGFTDFLQDQSEVLNRARQSKVIAFLNICTQLDEIPHIHQLSKQERDVFNTVGIHPHEVEGVFSNLTESELESLLKKEALESKVVGIGETGLDYYYHHSDQSHQKRSFRLHCQIALERDLPLVIHTREADEDTIRILDDYPGLRGVFHCFSGSEWLANEALARGFYLSFSGILTFKKADALREIAAQAPLEKLLVETDAPYLAPVPYRGQRNEPAFVVETAKVLSSIKALTFEEVASQTSANFFRLFSLAQL